MSDVPAQKRTRCRKSRKVTPIIAAPARHVETWSTVSGEPMLCELFATEDNSVVCGIMHEPTRSAQVPDLPDSWPLPHGTANSAQLVCRHVFHPAALALHFLVSDMRCPVCRAGHPQRMDIASVPEDLRSAYAEKSKLIDSTALQPVDDDIQRQDIVEVLAHMEIVFSVLGENNSLPDRAAVRTRVVFEAGHVHAILQHMHLSATLAQSDFSSELSVHRSFQRLVRSLVARQHASNPSTRVRFALVHPLVPVTIASEEMPVAEAWDKFFNCTEDDLQPPADRTMPMYCAAVAGPSPVGVLKAEFLDNIATPRLSLNVNTLMLVNIACYVREVLHSIGEALEQHTSFDSAPVLEFTTHAINGVVFE
jgi:hypothetical protein